jgi:hypothetical protein
VFQTLLRLVGVFVLMCVIDPWLVITVVPVIVVMTTLLFFSSRMLRGVRLLRDKGKWDKGVGTWSCGQGGALACQRL